jgi:hypothetical protein
MRHMWLWVLVYAIGAGFILLVCAFFTVLLPGHYLISDIVSKIWRISYMVGLVTTLCGFWVLIAGFVLLLIRGKFSAGRLVSLVGIGFYYLAALGFFLAGTVSWTPARGTFIAFVLAACVCLLGFFLMRTLRRAQKAENTEN